MGLRRGGFGERETRLGGGDCDVVVSENAKLMVKFMEVERKPESEWNWFCGKARFQLGDDVSNGLGPG